MNKLNSTLIMLAIVFLGACSSTNECEINKTGRLLFNSEWKFVKGEAEGAEDPGFDDGGWQLLDLPHDWSIEGPFSKENPSFSRGGWLPAGKCAYRKTFTIPKNMEGKRFVIYFDGVYRNSEVWINGHHLGKRPFGYIAFHYELTDHLNFGGSNTLTVKVDNSSQPGSRWYTGTGIYRNVHLITTEKLYVPVWGNYIVANEYSADEAPVRIETMVNNDLAEPREFIIRHTASGPGGNRVSSTEIAGSLDPSSQKTYKSELRIPDPKLWDTEKPNLYSIRTELLVDGQVIYSEENRTGIRSLAFDHEKGFSLNGEVVKLKGVCLHHDGGPLGAAIYRRTTERQLEILREMGCNAVRTAHNPFSEEFLDVCDEMGFLVMNESFDEWELPKSPATTQNGKKIRIPVDFYAGVFKEWADRDMSDFILRDRNHPSVIMWSIGNEIDQMRRPEGEPIGRRLSDIVHSLDYRPATNGVHGYGWGVWPDPGAAATSDIYGYNYIKDDGLEKEREQNPDVMAVITEHESAQSFYPRSTYLFGEAKKAWWDKLGYASGEAFEWVERRDIRGVSGMDAWKWIKERDYIMGLFIWTGWDYLGEVIPFGWPARSSSFGPIDLCGFPKDGFYFYQSQWTGEPMVHIFPHWNLEGHEGEVIPVYCFTNGDEVELFLNGESLGKQGNDTGGVEYQSWEVAYEPGELRAVAYRDGNPWAEKIIRTSGEPAKIELNTRRNEMDAGGKDLIYIECSLVDKDGNPVPSANNLLNFDVEGPAVIIGVGNGNNMSHEPFRAGYRKAFNGKCLAIIKSTPDTGDILFTAESEGLESARIELRSK